MPGCFLLGLDWPLSFWDFRCFIVEEGVKGRVRDSLLPMYLVFSYSPEFPLSYS